MRRTKKRTSMCKYTVCPLTAYQVFIQIGPVVFDSKAFQTERQTTYFIYCFSTPSRGSASRNRPTRNPIRLSKNNNNSSILHHISGVCTKFHRNRLNTLYFISKRCLAPRGRDPLDLPLTKNNIICNISLTFLVSVPC